jgi:DnaJ family protein C protein 2
LYNLLTQHYAQKNNTERSLVLYQPPDNMSATEEIIGPVPADWKGDDSNPNFRAIGTLSSPEMLKLEPVGPQFLAYARRKRHNRTFSEDDRIQAAKQVKNIETEDAGEISEDEDPAMLQRDAKDWKVCFEIFFHYAN